MQVRYILMCTIYNTVDKPVDIANSKAELVKHRIMDQ